MPGIPLRIAEPTGRYQRNLRRYSPSHGLDGCPAGGYHNANVIAGEIPASEVTDAAGDKRP
jgi:hypothetical protein